MGKRSWLHVALVGAVVIVLLNTWLAARALHTLINAQFWQLHTLEVIWQTETLVAEVRAAESAARGYVLTGLPSSNSNMRLLPGRSATARQSFSI